jgi:peptidyl-prolyl cis-trans isomerase C
MTSILNIRLGCDHAARRRLAVTAVFAMQLLWSGCSPAPTEKAVTEAPKTAAVVEVTSSGPVVAKVNGVEIRESDVALAEEDIGQEMQAPTPEAKRDQLIAYLGDMILIVQAAEAKKIQDTDTFKKRLDFYRKKLLMETLMSSEAKGAVTEAAMRKVYDDATKQMTAEEEVRARHILVESEEEAKAIREELEKGADFAELAKSKSKDPGAAAEGGDLGYFAKEQMVPEFAGVAFKLEPGKLSDPVKSPFGWHIIKVEDKRNRPLPEYDRVRGQIESFVMRKAQAEYVAKLRDSAKIERLEKPAAAPGAPADASKTPEAKPAEPK